MCDYTEPSTEMLQDILWNSIWNAIREWDINVPSEYGGYMGATGNHVTAIYKNIERNLFDASSPAKLTQEGDECPLCHHKVYSLKGALACACIDIDEDGNIF
jgi:hypothetical protein